MSNENQFIYFFIFCHVNSSLLFHLLICSTITMLLMRAFLNLRHTILLNYPFLFGQLHLYSVYSHFLFHTLLYRHIIISPSSVFTSSLHWYFAVLMIYNSITVNYNECYVYFHFNLEGIFLIPQISILSNSL